MTGTDWTLSFAVDVQNGGSPDHRSFEAHSIDRPLHLRPRSLSRATRLAVRERLLAIEVIGCTRPLCRGLNYA